NSTLLAGTQNNDGSNTIWWELTNTAVEPGIYTVEVTARDNAANAGAVTSYTFTLGDFQPPTVISWTYNSGQPLTSQVAASISKVTATMQDQLYGGGLNLSTCTIGLYDVNGVLLAGVKNSDSIATISWVLNATLAQSTTMDSAYQVRVFAEDLAGNDTTYVFSFVQQKQANTSNITLQANSFTCTPSVISPNADTRFDTVLISFVATSCDTVVPVVQFFQKGVVNAFSTIDTAASANGRLDSTVLAGGLSQYRINWNPGAALPVGNYEIEVRLGNRINGNVVLYPTVLGWIIWDTLIDTPVVTAPTDSALIPSNEVPYVLTVSGSYGTNGDSVYLRVTPAAGAATQMVQKVTSGIYSFTVSLNYGWTTLEVWAQDTAGNISGIVRRRVRLVNGSGATDIVITIGSGNDRDPVLHDGEGMTIGLPFGTTDGGLEVYSTDGRSTVQVRAVDTDGDGCVDKIVWDGTGNNIIKGVYIFKLQYTLNGQVYVETFPLAIVP
ncbi:MAG TPA: hypothetical protein PKM88_13310, partial [bacterium]|nr:hypothetical protein [bacterium]